MSTALSAWPRVSDVTDAYDEATYRPRLRPWRWVRHALAALVIVIGTSLATGAVVADPATAASVVATTAVNVRTGPGTDYRVLGVLAPGQRVDKLSSSGAWTKIKYGRIDGWAASAYLSVRGNAPKAPVVVVGTKITTTAVNLRYAPGTQSRIDRVLPKGTKVGVTGRTSKGFAEVIFGGARRWASAQYLATALPRVIGSRVATADLIIRSTSGSDYEDLGEIKRGSKVAVTGTTQNGKAQIVHRQAVRWVTARYLANPTVNQPPAPPQVVGYRWATTALLLRSNAGSDYEVLGEVPKGTKLAITGRTSNGRSQILRSGALRWVTSAYLSRSTPSSGGSGVEKGLQPNAIKVHRAAMAAFPQVSTYYGVRPDSIPDHPSGLALDIMIPGNYRSSEGRALGKRIADWAKANQASLGIEYIIWDQHIWNVKRSGEGWRYMADRGSDSANHKNHVHVTVLP